MNLQSFFDYNEFCPICGNKLHLYLHALNDSVWKAEKIDNFKYKFSSFINENENDEPPDDDFTFTLKVKDNETNIEFHSSRINIHIRNWELNLFFICNESSINTTLHYSFSVDPYNCCYYRESMYMGFRNLQKGNKKWKLVESVNGLNLVNIGEYFSFHQNDKRYLIHFDYEINKTIFSYYIDEKAHNTFDSYTIDYLLDKEQLNLNDKDKLIRKLDSWILFS